MPERGTVVDLLWTLVRTDFKVRYHGTLGGFAWALLKPLVMFLVLLAVFSFIFAGSPGYKLNLVVGLFLWDFFAEGTKVGLLSLQAKSFLVTRARFPVWILVAASCSNAVITLFVFGCVFLVFLALNGQAPGALAVGLTAFYFVHYLAIVVGISLATSVLFLRYRDLNQVWEVLTQAGFFLAPIVYPLEILPERFHFYLYLWPPTPVMQFTRMVLVGGVVPSLRGHVLLSAEAAVILLAGIFVYRRLAPRAVEAL